MIICVYESSVLWKGKLKFKHYLPLKRKPFAIKFFEPVDCISDFLIVCIVYTGSETDYEKFGMGICNDIVAYFLKNDFNKAHIVYLDNWYLSPQLSERIGTICKNCKRNWKTGEDVVKPSCICDYNKNKGGVDNIDRHSSLQKTIRKTINWYTKFFHLMDLSLSNAHVLYHKYTEAKLSLPQFRLETVTFK